MGFEAACDEAAAPGFAGYVLAADVSAKTEKEVRFCAEKNDREVIKANFGMDDTISFFKKRVGVFLIQDEGLFRAVKKHIAAENTENE